MKVLTLLVCLRLIHSGAASLNLTCPPGRPAGDVDLATIVPFTEPGVIFTVDGISVPNKEFMLEPGHQVSLALEGNFTTALIRVDSINHFGEISFAPGLNSVKAEACSPPAVGVVGPHHEASKTTLAGTLQTSTWATGSFFIDVTVVRNTSRISFQRFTITFGQASLDFFGQTLCTLCEGGTYESEATTQFLNRGFSSCGTTFARINERYVLATECSTIQTEFQSSCGCQRTSMTVNPFPTQQPSVVSTQQSTTETESPVAPPHECSQADQLAQGYFVVIATTLASMFGA